MAERRRPDSWFRPFLKRYRRTLALALLLGVVTTTFASALMVTSGYLIGESALLPASVLLLNIPLMLVRFFGVGKPVLRYIERLVSHDWVLRVTSRMRLKLYRALESDAVFFRMTHRIGDALGMLSTDIGHLQNLYLRTVFPLVIAWTISVLASIALGVMTPWMGATMALVLVVATVFAPLVSMLANSARISRRKALGDAFFANIADDVMGASDWIFAGRQQECIERHEHVQSEAFEEERRIRAFDRKRDTALQVVFAALAVMITAWASGYFGSSGQGSWIIAVVLGYFPLLETLEPISAAAQDSIEHRDSLKRLNDLPNASDELDSEESGGGPTAGASCTEATSEQDGTAGDRVSGYGIDSGSPGIEAGSGPAPDIHISNVHFAYPGEPREVLSGMTIDIPFGQKVAVLGRSGAGKSTAALLIRGDLRPTEGHVIVGDTEASDLGEHASKLIGMIQQHTYLFNTSLRDNLRIARPDADDDQIREVLSRVGLSDTLGRLPDGLDTIVDEGGFMFSGGERHRIALARVLLQDVPIVVLDEPTVGLDPATEHEVLGAMLKSLEGRTCVMITHHLQGVGCMDRVVFIKDGRVVLDGSPNELERSNERYRQIAAFDRGMAGFSIEGDQGHLPCEHSYD